MVYLSTNRPVLIMINSATNTRYETKIGHACVYVPDKQPTAVRGFTCALKSFAGEIIGTFTLQST